MHPFSLLDRIIIRYMVPNEEILPEMDTDRNMCIKRVVWSIQEP